MPKFDTTRLVSHTPENMFALVADVEKYPEFLPLCEGLIVKSRKERDDKTLLIAEMSIGYKAIRETFTSQVLLDPNALTIEVQYLNGPFKYLNNHWLFVPRDTGTEVNFFVDFEFNSRILQAAIGLVFNEAVRRMVAAFHKRAIEVYGPAQPSPRPIPRGPSLISPKS